MNSWKLYIRSKDCVMGLKGLLIKLKHNILSRIFVTYALISIRLSLPSYLISLYKSVKVLLRTLYIEGKPFLKYSQGA